ncbi:hypothetical protein VTJ04DRAFT_9904 [Mycothermus thermophilus]|uniref:uncharacterized protein n=1 Tax=Humicola insolens TaxID=85995 RepID=UPI0037424D1C
MRGRKTIEGGRICGQPVHLNDCSSLQTKGRIVDVVERRTRKLSTIQTSVVVFSSFFFFPSILSRSCAPLTNTKKSYTHTLCGSLPVLLSRLISFTLYTTLWFTCSPHAFQRKGLFFSRHLVITPAST